MEAGAISLRRYSARGSVDSIIQAAGRCNREGRLRGLGRVEVFRPPDDSSPPGVYRSGRDIARVVRELPGFDPHDPDAVRRYFELLFGTAVNTDTNGVQQARKNLDFPAVADKFRMIDEDACDIIVDYPERESPKIDSLVEQLRARERPAREILRELQPHMVSIYRSEYDRRLRDRFIDELLPGVGRWPLGYYDAVLASPDADPKQCLDGVGFDCETRPAAPDRAAARAHLSTTANVSTLIRARRTLREDPRQHSMTRRVWRGRVDTLSPNPVKVSTTANKETK